MPSIHKSYLGVTSLFGQNPDAYGTDALISEKAPQTLNSIITDRSLNYITKKEVLNKNVARLAMDTITQYNKLDQVKADIGSY